MPHSAGPGNHRLSPWSGRGSAGVWWFQAVSKDPQMAELKWMSVTEIPTISQWPGWARCPETSPNIHKTDCLIFSNEHLQHLSFANKSGILEFYKTTMRPQIEVICVYLTPNSSFTIKSRMTILCCWGKHKPLKQIGDVPPTSRCGGLGTSYFVLVTDACWCQLKVMNDLTLLNYSFDSWDYASIYPTASPFRLHSEVKMRWVLVWVAL